MPSEPYYPYLLEAISVHNVLPLTSRCNLACIFCSHRQNPPGVASFHLPPQPADMLLELAAFLDPGRKVVIGEAATRLDEGEPFTHPDCLRILASLRSAMPGTLLAVTTNGTMLTAPVLDELSSLLPLELTVSLNSASKQGRRLLLNDQEPESVPRAITRLASSGIPFHGSLVAMPHLVGMTDIEETILFLAEHGALTVRLFLPGYTRYAPRELHFPLQAWSKLIELAGSLTRELSVPVIPEPVVCGDFNAEIYSVIRDTPARRSGLQRGDIIASVNGNAPLNRVDAFRQASAAANPELHLERNGQKLSATLQKGKHEPPGFVMHYDFDPLRADSLAREISRVQASAPLILCSQFGEKAVQKAIATLAGLPPVTIRPVTNNFFGGSIMSAGLLVTEDLLAAARQAEGAHDLVLVPAEAFDRSGRDLTGRSISDMEGALGFPVRAV